MERELVGLKAIEEESSDVKPVVGVTAGTDLTSNGPARYRLNRAYLTALVNAGAVPIVLVPGVDFEALFDRLDGIVLTGGVDVDPEFYGQMPAPETKVDRVRDDLELPLARAAFDQRKPILAICRGHQVINVALGGTLIQHLGSHPRSDPDGDRSALSHTVRLDQESLLGRLVGRSHIGVNSFHHQAVKDVAPLLRAVGWSDDGVIEALESDASYVISVQSHPEELIHDQPWARQLFDAFVERSSAKSIH